MGRDRDTAESPDELVLLERTTPESFRKWNILQTFGVEVVPAGFLRTLPSGELPPVEEELRELLQLMLPGDELWLCRSSIFCPDQLIGNQGIAIVRNGKPVRYRSVIHY